MLTDNEIAILDTHEFGCVWYWDDKLRFARAIEAAATEPLLQRIAELEAKLEQQDAEPVAYEYRWTNPGNNPDTHPEEIAWKPVRSCVIGQTIENAAKDLEAYHYDDKPVYEVRALYTHPAPKQVPLTDAQIKASCKQTWVFETARQWVRMVEAAHGITGETK